MDAAVPAKKSRSEPTSSLQGLSINDRDASRSGSSLLGDRGASSSATGNQSQAASGGLPSVNLPRGGGAIRSIGETFSVSPSTGSASASIPLPVSAGRSGFQPSLALSYDSGGGNSPFGFGWHLSLASISRKTDLGLPTYHDAEETDTYVFTGSEDLVPVLERQSNGEWCRQMPKRRVVEDIEYDVFFYRPRIEATFSRVERWVNLKTHYVHWRAITRSNLVTIFGADENSRIYDQQNPTHVFQWLASKTYDDKGNIIIFEYKAENSEGVHLTAAHELYRPACDRAANRYIKRVKYGNRVSHLVEPINDKSEWMFEIVFDYGDHDDVPLPRESKAWPARTDPFSTYRPGFEVRTYRLCHRVLMFHHFPEEPNMGWNTLVAALTISYFKNGLNSSTNLSSASCASSFQRLSYVRDGERYLQDSMPPVELEYAEAKISNTVCTLSRSALEGIPSGVGFKEYEFLDLDGEGASGILAYESGSYFYKSPLGNGNFGPPVQLPQAPSLHVGKAKPPQWMDLLGDGHMDMVELDSVTPGFYKRNNQGERDGWEPFKQFKELPNVLWNNTNLRMVDLTGDGHADVFITEDDIFTYYPSLLEDGFGTPRYWRPPLDENRGPRLLLSDTVESLFLADMTGDGLSDLVRIRYCEVCYWPNRGYGRFGSKISMTGAPLFDSQDCFQQSRLRLADIDGTGTTDILYLNGPKTTYYLNQSGNGFTAGTCITAFPTVDDTTNVQLVDLLVKGTSCLVWSSSLGVDSGTQIRYVDLMVSGKPYLVLRSANNLGSETRYSYKSSTKYYLEDKLVGLSWPTKLPFPVQVVDKVETIDYVGKNRYMTRYAYHSGHYDGTEREFRGFGFVETWDTEDISTLMSHSLSKASLESFTNWDKTSTTPPVHTKTWYHTGFYSPSFNLEEALSCNYYQGDIEQRIPSSKIPRAINLGSERYLPYVLNSTEILEAYRAFKGMTLRSEIYSNDGTPISSRPYVVNQSNYNVELLQPMASNKHAIFHLRPFEAAQSFHDRQLYEFKGQVLADPRISHSFTLKFDDYGDVLQAVTIGYGRSLDDASSLLTAEDRAKQRKDWVTLTEAKMTNAVIEDDTWLLPVSSESRVYQLFNLRQQGSHRRLVSFEYIQSVVKRLESGQFDLPYQAYDGPAPTDYRPHRRLIQHGQTFFRKNDLTGPLPLGKIESLAFPYRTLALVYDKQLVTDTYIAHGKLSQDEVNDIMVNQAGYIRSEDGNWWAPSGKVYFTKNRNHTPAEELAYGRKHFFLPERSEHIFSTKEDPINSLVTYDKYSLLVQETCDALGNRLTAGERDKDPTKPLVRHGQDYRILEPWLAMDQNRNLTLTAFDVMGLPVGTANIGKPEKPEGDSLDEFTVNLSKEEVQSFYKAPLHHLQKLLGTATSRYVYDQWAFYRTKNQDSPQPVWSATLARETHVSQLERGEKSRVFVKFSYSDGVGRVIQEKQQAEPGPLMSAGPPIDSGSSSESDAKDIVKDRWVGSGWVVYNNKGKPVRQFEPFFTDVHSFQNNAKVGVSPILFYDPLQRVIGTIQPDHTITKVRTDPWKTTFWDADDNVLLSDTKMDPDIGGYVRRLPESDYLPTWYERRITGAEGLEEKVAAEKAALHAETPGTIFFDAMSRAFVSFDTIRTQRSDEPTPKEEIWRNTSVLDIKGSQRRVYDSLDRLVTVGTYNYAQSLMHQTGMENGERWILQDALGNVLLSWDSRKQRLRISYDKLRRPIGAYLSLNNSKEVLVEQTIYGESLPNPETHNTRMRIVEIRDQAGVNLSASYDFKANLVESGHRIAIEYRETLDWSQDIALDKRNYQQFLAYDALNRVTSTVLPDGTTTKTTYNARGHEVAISSWLQGEKQETPVLVDAEYNARSQRTKSVNGNGTVTYNSYDPMTFRPVRILTARMKKKGKPKKDTDLEEPIRLEKHLQDLRYIYDAYGNVTSVVDKVQVIIYNRNMRIDPSQQFTYDSTYRLVESHGREHLGQSNSKEKPPGAGAHSGAIRLDHPHDGTAMGRYVERYHYDKASNFTRMDHYNSTSSQGWSRHYDYEEKSMLESSKVNNRLSRTRIGSRSEHYRYEGLDGIPGNMTSMPRTRHMHWDYRNRLATSSAVESPDGNSTSCMTYYRYDSTGKRVRKITEATRSDGTRAPVKESIYIGGAFEIFRRYHKNGKEVKLELQTPDILTATGHRIARAEFKTISTGENRIPDRLIRFQYGDRQGSGTLELDSEARIITYSEYTPYGETSYEATGGQTEVPQRYRYVGKELDDNSGLYYMGARYYAAWLGRWTSADPAGLGDGLNLFVYTHCNPVSFTDPVGTNAKGGPKMSANHNRMQKLTALLLEEQSLEHELEVVIKSGKLGSRVDILVKLMKKYISIEIKTMNMWHYFEKGGLKDPKLYEALARHIAQVQKHIKDLAAFAEKEGVAAGDEGIIIFVRGFNEASKQFKAFATAVTEAFEEAGIKALVIHHNSAEMKALKKLIKAETKAAMESAEKEAPGALAKFIRSLARRGGKSALAKGGRARMRGSAPVGMMLGIAAVGVALVLSKDDIKADIGTFQDKGATNPEKVRAGVDLASIGVGLVSPEVGAGLAIGGTVGPVVSGAVEETAQEMGMSPEGARKTGVVSGVVAGAIGGAIGGAVLGAVGGVIGACLGGPVGLVAGKLLFPCSQCSFTKLSDRSCCWSQNWCCTGCCGRSIRRCHKYWLGQRLMPERMTLESFEEHRSELLNLARNLTRRLCQPLKHALA
jgi:RHS repeat-associated protein